MDKLYYYVNPRRNVIHKSTCKHVVSSNKINLKGKWVEYNSLQEAEEACKFKFGEHYQHCENCFNLSPDGNIISVVNDKIYISAFELIQLLRGQSIPKEINNHKYYIQITEDSGINLSCSPYNDNIDAP